MKNTTLLMEAYYTNCFKAYGIPIKEAFGVKYAESGIPTPLFNGIIDCPLLDQKNNEAASYFDNYYRQLGLPYCWWINTCSGSIPLDSALIDVGLNGYAGFTGWVFDLEAHIPQENDSKMDISPLQTSEEALLWSKCLIEAFDMPDSIVESFSNLHLPGCTKENFVHLKGTHKGEIVSTGSVLFEGNAAYFYNLSTSPGFQNKGYGTAMISKRIEIARNKGCKFIFVRTSPFSGRLYKKIGFKEISQYKIFF